MKDKTLRPLAKFPLLHLQSCGVIMPQDVLLINKSDFKNQLLHELEDNILPFWINHVVDKENGGFYGAITNDLEIHNEKPRSAILCARILWTYAIAYRRLRKEEYIAMARWAYDYLTQVFWDQEYGGLYWEVDARGHPVSDRKHHYAQAFGIYGLTEYYKITKEQKSLQLAQNLFHLLEQHAFDTNYQGYFEGSTRAWKPLTDTQLSEREIDCSKSMNTMLHILEAYTNLLRVWKDDKLKNQHCALIHVFQKRILDSHTGHFKLFFDNQLNSLSELISFGHDIEGSWLLWEAAEMQGDRKLSESIREVAIHIATAVYQEGTDEDGSLVYEADSHGWTDTCKSWWAQAEAMVGFYNAYQLSGQVQFEQAALRCWSYIQDKVVDKVNGDWFKELHRDGTPDNSRFKVSPWDCPYHHSRACLEMISRLDDTT